MPTTVATGASPSRSVSLMKELNRPKMTTTGQPNTTSCYLMTYRNHPERHRPNEAA